MPEPVWLHEDSDDARAELAELQRDRAAFDLLAGRGFAPRVVTGPACSVSTFDGYADLGSAEAVADWLARFGVYEG